jgi:hypothetical protein
LEWIERAIDMGIVGVKVKGRKGKGVELRRESRRKRGENERKEKG